MSTDSTCDSTKYASSVWLNWKRAVARRLEQVGEDLCGLYLTRVAISFVTFANASKQVVVSGRSCQTWTVLLNVGRCCCVKDLSVIVRLFFRNFDHHDIEITV